MLNQEMIEKLNTQINLEFFSSNLYLQMSAWATGQGLDGCAAFFKAHANEEMQHMQRIFDYVLESGKTPVLGRIEAPTTDFSDIRTVFAQTLEHEKAVTQAINELVELAFNQKDFASFQFLQWFVSEQHEEEALFQGIIDKIDLIGDDRKNLFFIDREVAKIAASHP
ncbi:non-heme ferritin [Ostreibacterium oceani]|uniref:Ferritin n=1 Tax=Ostreibacterium oceani TaxID=2654998 RepID=A0A6N7EYG8_9GAMM|nr:non-heme ferritin [Ostreibacterium oceani]MPV86429.1 non-heme ferritin [Ostreibacterium oceani]